VSSIVRKLEIDEVSSKIITKMQSMTSHKTKIVLKEKMAIKISIKKINRVAIKSIPPKVIERYSGK